MPRSPPAWRRRWRRTLRPPSVLEAVHSARPLPAVQDETPAGGGAAPAEPGTILRTDPAAEGFSGSTSGRPGAGIVSLDARRRRLPAAAAAAVFLPGIALGGWSLGAQSEQRHQEELLAAREQDRENLLLGASDATTHRIEVEGGTATLFVSQEQDTALFVSTDLPDPGPGREYQLWLVQEDVPVPDAHFTGGQVRTWLHGEVADAAAAAMTVEPAGGSTSPTLPVVAATEI